MLELKLKHIIVVFIFLLCIPRSPALDENGLIAHFTFDEDTLSELKSTVENHIFSPREGVRANLSKVEFSRGVHGKSIHLKNGNTVHYCLPPGTLTDFKPPFTIAAWIKRTTVKTKNNHGVFCGTCADPKAFGFEFSWFWFSLRLSWGNNGKNYSVSSPPRSLFVNKWHHVAAVHDGKTVRLYIDGMPVAEKSIDAGFADIPGNRKNANRFTLGQYPTNFCAYPHVGLMDDLFLFSRALSREEIITMAEGIK